MSDCVLHPQGAAEAVRRGRYGNPRGTLYMYRGERNTTQEGGEEIEKKNMEFKGMCVCLEGNFTDICVSPYVCVCFGKPHSLSAQSMSPHLSPQKHLCKYSWLFSSTACSTITKILSCLFLVEFLSLQHIQHYTALLCVAFCIL